MAVFIMICYLLKSLNHLTKNNITKLVSSEIGDSLESQCIVLISTSPPQIECFHSTYKLL